VKQLQLAQLTVDELVDYFAQIGISQYKSEVMDEISNYNALFKQMNQIDDELKKRGVDARLALLKLYDHPNVQVRLKAAVRTLAVAPDAARRVLRDIKDSNAYPQAADASLFLRDFDNGSYRPD
jgi:hypothetical protein